MQLTTFTDYGLRTLIYLAEHPGQLSNVKEISEHYNISNHHLVKVVHRLAQLNYIKSTKGKGGGVELNPETLTLGLGDLVKKLETNMTLVECFDKKTNTCKITESCRLKHLLFDANMAFIKTLNHQTLQSIIKK